MLKRIGIQNLQSFDDAHPYSIPFTKEAILIGANNAGKSTVFNALNLMRSMLLNQGIRYTNEFHNLQSFDEAVHLHDMQRSISIILEVEEGENKFIYEMTITEGRVQDLVARRNGSNIDWQHPDVARNIRKIWYFAPIRSPIPHRLEVGNYSDVLQPLRASGYGVNQFLLQKFTEQDASWGEAQRWLNKIDPNLTLFKTPLRSNHGSVETTRKYGDKQADINLSLQGTGMQNAATIIAAIIFSPEDSTICIEEPESFLHPRSQEVLVDLFNYAANKLDKQVIVSTHSWDILKHFVSDLHSGIGREGARDAAKHEITDPKVFSLVTFRQDTGPDKISLYDLAGKKYSEERRYLSELLG